MAKCKICGKQFHACSSCYLDNNWQYQYCSSECHCKDEKTQKYYEMKQKFFKSLSKEQIDMLLYLMPYNDKDQVWDLYIDSFNGSFQRYIDQIRIKSDI